MNIRAKRLIVILITLVFTVSAFTITAFATDSPITPGDPASEPAASISSTALDSSSTESTSSVDSAAGSSSEGTGSSSLPSGSSAASGSAPASSHASTASSKYTSSQPTHSVDTQTSRVEAIASQAAQAVSDPNVLSSQDWGELLSGSSESTVQAGGTASDPSAASGASDSSGGGLSWLLLLGIGLIVLALGGIGFFVYAQFFSNKNGGRGSNYGPMDISSRSGKDAGLKDDSEPTEFVDISSDSDGTQHRGEYIPDKKPFENLRPAGTVNRAPAAKAPGAPKTEVRTPKISAKEITAPIPQENLPRQTPSVPTQDTASGPKSQATPVQEGKNFDWEKFFDDDDE